MPKASQVSDNELEKIAAPLVQEIFTQYHPNGQFGYPKRGGVLDRCLGVDWLFKDSVNGKITLLGAKIRRPRFSANVDVTIEEYNDPETLQVGDLYNSRMDEYLYGFIDEDCTGITKWIYLYFQEVCQLILDELIPCQREYNDSGGKASFLPIKSSHIPLKYIIGQKGFPTMETYTPL